MISGTGNATVLSASNSIRVSQNNDAEEYEAVNVLFEVIVTVALASKNSVLRAMIAKVVSSPNPEATMFNDAGWAGSAPEISLGTPDSTRCTFNLSTGYLSAFGRETVPR